jgi:hypothetical protein
MSLLDLLPNSCSIERLDETVSATGFVSKTAGWTSIATGVRCRVFEAPDDAKIIYGRLGVTVSKRFLFDADYGLGDGSKVRFRILFNGQPYEVRGSQAAYGLTDSPLLYYYDTERIAK